MLDRRVWGVSLLAWGITLVFMVPIFWMLGTSFKPAGEYVSESINLLPLNPTLQNYRELWAEGIWHKVLNSVVVGAGTTLLALAVGFPAAYTLARRGLPKAWDKLFLIFILLLKLTPPIVLAIPLYQVLRTLGLLDTLAGLVLVYQIYALPFTIWMLLGFIRDIPFALEEAALVDGVPMWRRLIQLVLPLAAPGLAATAIFVAILSWNEFLYALLFIQTPSKFTLPTYIATLITEDETFWGKLTAIGFLATLPILAAVSVVQKSLVRGFSSGMK